MKTIERILNYHLSEDQRDCLYEAGIINGCGGE